MTADLGQVPTFGAPETITVADLRVGDFVVRFPAQKRIRGLEVGSGVASIMPSVVGWYSQSRPRGPRFPVPASRVTFLMAKAVLDVPDECQIIVRRIEG